MSVYPQASERSTSPRSVGTNESNYEQRIRSKRRDLLVKLLQREIIQEGMFKEYQIHNGGGIDPSEASHEQTKDFAQALIRAVVQQTGNAGMQAAKEIAEKAQLP